MLQSESDFIPHAATLHSIGIDSALESKQNGSNSYSDYQGTYVIGVYRWLPQLNAALLVEQNFSEALQSIYTLLVMNVAIGLIAGLLAVGVSLVTTSNIALPLSDLVKLATDVASGNLSQKVPVNRDDEIGSLAQAFNSMTAQLQGLINNLEQRVWDRTQALQHRALQLETNALVSREISSILDINSLLSRVAELIRDSFGYYQVHIYLVESQNSVLALGATTGTEGSQPQQLPIEERNLNGQVVKTNQSVLLNDVERQRSGFPTNTKSELVVPLRLAEKVIGTLDVQSAQPNAFLKDDELVIQSLADQIAVAIENARLYEKAQRLAALEERQRLARELHDSVTQSLYSLTLFAEASRVLAESGDWEKVIQYQERIGGEAHQALREMRLLLFELQPLELEKEGLVGALRKRLNAIEKRTGIEVDFQVAGSGELPLKLQEGIFRIAQEALNNALKHARAKTVKITLDCNDGCCELLIKDNGVGFDLSKLDEYGGMGIKNMLERAKTMDAKLEITSEVEIGTQVKVRALFL